jgi:hypothetical protein
MPKTPGISFFMKIDSGLKMRFLAYYLIMLETTLSLHLIMVREARFKYILTSCMMEKSERPGLVLEPQGKR